MKIRQRGRPQITISESTKSARGKLIFSRFTPKQHQIHNRTKNGLNRLLL